MAIEHYEVQSQINPKYNETFDMYYYHGIYRVVKMIGNEVVEEIALYDSPNGGWNYNQAMELAGKLCRNKEVGTG